MEKEFWLDKWDINQIGFHQDKPNYFMEKYFSEIDLKDKTVFVPLCGKTLDMIWFAEKGAKVIGVELAPKAVKDFFSENEIAHSIKEFDGGEIYISDKITIYCCNLFDMPSDSLESVDYIFDRASLVALPEDIRSQYIETMKSVSKGAEYLLVTFIHPDKGMGPPFCIDENDVQNYYGDKSIKLLEKDTRVENFKGKEAEITSFFFHIS